MADGDDIQGGDPPCWAHQFEVDLPVSMAEGMEGLPEPLGVADLLVLASTASSPGVAWSSQSDDLNVNLLVFGRDGGVETHVNSEVDVLIVALSGDGILGIDGSFRPLRAGQALVVPKGSSRSIRAAGDRFAYLTCHRRRSGLWPTSRAIRSED